MEYKFPSVSANINIVDSRTKKTEGTGMNGKEFIKRVRKIGKSRGVACSVDEARGKVSHVTIYLGDNLTIVRNPKED